MKWFVNPQTLEELKQQYKKLAMENHPDIGGSVQAMQEINNEYDALFPLLKNKRKTAAGEAYTTESTEAANEFKDIINRLIHLQDIIIEVCGSWLWITGETYTNRNALKELKFRYSKSKSAWYYHTEDYKKSSSKTFSLDEIRGLYGSETIKSDSPLKLAII